MGLRSELCDGHSNTLTLLSLSHFPQLWKYAWGHCPFGRPICNQASTSWLMSWDVASIYPHNFPSSCCHLFWPAPVLPAAKHPHNMMLQPSCFTVGMVFFSLQASPFFLQTWWSLWSNSSIIVSSDQKTFLQKCDLCPHVHLQTVVWLFYGGFGAVASLLSGLSGYVNIGLVLLWI